jgi:8-oxo-dGTP pyrophosphatase MutT (NUDIX family)
VEHGEHPEATLQREVREETGLDATISTLLWVFDAPCQIHLCYLCFVPDREPALQTSEIIGCEWIDLTAPDPRRMLERQRAADVLAGQGLPPDASRSRATTPMPR